VFHDHALWSQGDAGRCRTRPHFFDGDYCVPEHDAANTKRIFSLLAELLALKTMANELAITPLVRVVP